MLVAPHVRAQRGVADVISANTSAARVCWLSSSSGNTIFLTNCDYQVFRKAQRYLVALFTTGKSTSVRRSGEAPLVATI